MTDTNEKTYTISKETIGQGDGWKIGQFVKVKPEQFDGNEILVVISSSSDYFNDGDYICEATCRAATAKEVKNFRMSPQQALKEIQKSGNEISKPYRGLDGLKVTPREFPQGEELCGVVRMSCDEKVFVVNNEEICYCDLNWDERGTRTGEVNIYKGIRVYSMPYNEELATKLRDINTIIVNN